VDMLSLSAHKAYGPKGVGALFLRKGLRIAPLLHGGLQERGLRAGTENVCQIAGMAKASLLAADRLEKDSQYTLELRRLIEESVVNRIDGVRIHGHPEHRLPQTANISFEGVDGLTLLIRLDLLGFVVSTGSACSSGSPEVSHVHAALGEGRGGSAIRVSLGRQTRKEDCLAFVQALEDTVRELRSGS
jgi:cysteine desulfurase